jgi:glyoxylase-like metal-dependent hydrolase (beta-lactamase superfamily II)
MSSSEWTQPGCYEVAPGVYRIPLPLPNDGLRAVNVYAFVGPDGPTLIDSGWAIPQARRQLSDSLRTLGSSLSDIQRFLITHVHRDHYTQAVQLRREFGTRVTLGVDERWSLDKTMHPGQIAIEQVQRLRSFGAGDLAEKLAGFGSDVDIADWELPNDWLEDDDVIAVNDRVLNVVHTPGHTRGHVVFHDVPGSLLFAGDHVLPTITPSIGFEPAFAIDPLGDFLRSLAAIRRREDATLLPAHGPATTSVHARIDELIAHHEKRLSLVLAAVEWGASTAAEVAAELRWTRIERRLTDLDPFNTYLAIGETSAHLDLLASQGRLTVQVVGDDEVRHYGASSGHRVVR